MKWEREFSTSLSLFRYYYIAVFSFALLSILFANSYTSGGLLHPKQAAYDVIYYDLSLIVFPEKKYLKSEAITLLRSLIPIDSLRLDLVDHYVVNEVKINNENSIFTHTRDILLINLPNDISGLIEATVLYEGKPPVAPNHPWDGGFTWSYDSVGNPWIGMSSANEGGKVFFPCKDHPSDRVDCASIAITVPKGLSAASYG